MLKVFCFFFSKNTKFESIVNANSAREHPIIIYGISIRLENGEKRVKWKKTFSKMPVFIFFEENFQEFTFCGFPGVPVRDLFQN